MDFEEKKAEAELAVRDGNYLMSVFVSPGVTLSVEIERKSDGCIWRGDFNARYIEAITLRAGNVKSFANFVKMLESATRRDSCSSSLHLDMLTYRDLERLKTKNGSVEKENSLANGAATNDKRYLILTYTTEFDRVHYPLPLQLEETSTSEVMGRCIHRLRNELDSVKTQLKKYEAPQTFRHRTKSGFSGDEYNENKRSAESRRYESSGTSERLSDSKSEQHASTLQKQVKELQEKLRIEQISHKKLITTLVRKNTILQDEARHAKLVQRKLSEKLRENEFRIKFLQGKLKSQEAARKAPSPIRSRQRFSASPPLGPNYTQQRRFPHSISPPTPHRQLSSASSTPPGYSSQQRRFQRPPSPPVGIPSIHSGQRHARRPPPPKFPRSASGRCSNSGTPPRYRAAEGSRLRSHSCPNMRTQKDIGLNDWQGGGIARKRRQLASSTATTPRRIYTDLRDEPVIQTKRYSNLTDEQVIQTKRYLDQSDEPVIQTKRYSGQSDELVVQSSVEQEKIDDIANEVGEIDSRLYALQDYLKRISDK